jgi:hypothetical protein
MSETWPFDPPKDCAAISLKSVVFGGKPILRVSHDADDHGWQFLDGEDVDSNDAAVVSMEEIVKLDASVLEIADLPPGFIAWRDTPTSPWKRGPNKR